MPNATMPGAAVLREGINWHAHARVEKFSPDQVAWAARESGLVEPKADVLRVLCGAPEDGTVERDGNLLVTVGLNVVTELIIGSGGISLDQAHTIAGVGASTANNAAVGDTALADDNGANAYYQNVDSGSNPSQSNGVITATCTFTGSNANFAWNEWCLAVTSGTITAGDHLSAMASPSPTMINHKMYSSGLGTKSSGASWVLTSSITLTLLGFDLRKRPIVPRGEVSRRRGLESRPVGEDNGYGHEHDHGHVHLHLEPVVRHEDPGRRCRLPR